jgi:hypothetical protein
MGLVWYVMPEIWKMEGDQSFRRELAAIYAGSGESDLVLVAFVEALDLPYCDSSTKARRD